MRAAWLAAGTVATAIALLMSTVLLWREFASARTPADVTQRSIPFMKDKVQIQAVAGQVSLVLMPGRAGELLINRTLRWSRDRPDVTEDWNARTSTLRLKAVCPGADQPDGPVCRATYMIMVPPETDIVAGTTEGMLSVENTFGNLRLTSVSGFIQIDGVFGTVWARTRTGDIEADRIDGEQADVEVGAGNVDLWFVNPPTSVRAVVRTAGAVGVNLPRTGAYDVTAEATNVTLDIKRDEQSPRKIIATVGDGSVTLCCR
ncbi:hypothetical protein [Nonomuraea sp. SYSU D8015]|uniref:hypothetical protein n=1 Tax=Nonomuraea sp. SYSU D8015 TaxID=2593644 RepID=UPI001660E619|nr:hypothetical protein [Nonomuraea sp. SYSU D8015]